MRRVLLVLALLAPGTELAAQRMQMLVPLDTLIARAERDSLDAPAHYDLALGYWLKKKYDLADQHLRKAIAIEPKTAQAYLALAFLPYARRPKLWDEVYDGKVPAEWQAPAEEAYGFYRRAFLLDPLVDLKPLALGVPPSSTLGLSRAGRVYYEYFANGYGAFWDGQYNVAYRFFQEIGPKTDAERQETASWFLWYETLAGAHLGDIPRATTNLQILVDRWEKRADNSSYAVSALARANDYRYVLGCVADMASDSKEAIRLLQEVLVNDAGAFAAHSRLASIYEELHRDNAAVEERRRAVAADPENSSLLYDLGVALARSGQLSDAQAALRQAVQMNPLNARSLFMLATVAQKVDAKDEARASYERFIAIAPSRFEAQRAEARQHLAELAAK